MRRRFDVSNKYEQKPQLKPKASTYLESNRLERGSDFAHFARCRPCSAGRCSADRRAEVAAAAAAAAAVVAAVVDGRRSHNLCRQWLAAATAAAAECRHLAEFGSCWAATPAAESAGTVDSCLASAAALGTVADSWRSVDIVAFAADMWDRCRFAA